MLHYHGMAVYPGVAIGKALVFDPEGMTYLPESIAPDQVDVEISRLDSCLGHLSTELFEDAELVRKKFGEQIAEIFAAHARLISDPVLRDSIVARIESEHNSVEFAVRQTLGEYRQFFLQMGEGHLSQRATDITDIETRILRKLAGERVDPIKNLKEPVIILANDLTPSETASFDKEMIKGLATQEGGRTSHTAIIAAAMNLPCIVGIGKFLHEVKSGDQLIVDGHTGMLIVNPDPETLQKYEWAGRNHELAQLRRMDELRDLSAETIDGTRVYLMGNIEFPHEARQCLERGADGIGLYRTEFLYLQGDHSPDEEEHFSAYRKVLEAIGPDKPVTFRTMDLGADKVYPGTISKEYNPFLGLRSIRLSLKDIKLFKVQLRALLRASIFGNVKIMFPLVSTVPELRRCKMLLAETQEDLDDNNVPYSPRIPVGMMMEVPAAAIMAHHFAPLVDFFSIGTNDLIQYTLACDRTNAEVANLYTPADPAVIHLIQTVVKAAKNQGIDVNVCGEMSGDPQFTMLLLGMGLRQLSVSPHAIPEIKQVIRKVTISDCEKLVERVIDLDSTGTISNLLQSRLRQVDPELAD